MNGKTKNIVDVYIDMTDFYHYIPDDPRGIQIYFKKEHVLKHEKCCREGGCGIVKLKLDLSTKEVVQEENWDTMVTNLRKACLKKNA